MSNAAALIDWALDVLLTGRPAPVPDAYRPAFTLAGLPPTAPDLLPARPLQALLAGLTLQDADAPPATPHAFPYAVLGEAYPYPAPDAGAARPTPPAAEADAARSHPHRALVFLERYGAFAPFADAAPDVSFYDGVRVAAACQAALDAGHPETPFLLVAADFSGIQDFVYTISSKGALKSLRARSFLLEMLTEHILYELIEAEPAASRAAVLYAAGGGFGLLLPHTDTARAAVEAVQNAVNGWLWRTFGGRLYLALAARPAAPDALRDRFAATWEALQNDLDAAKRRRFREVPPEELFRAALPTQLTNEAACQVCRRDDLPPGEHMLELATPTPTPWAPGSDEAAACPADYHLFHLGDDLIAEDPRRPLHVYRSAAPLSRHYLRFPTRAGGWAYYAVGGAPDPAQVEAVWVANSWDLRYYTAPRTFPLVLADYVRSVADLPAHAAEVEHENYRRDHGRPMQDPHRKTASFAGLAAAACGADLIAALRMDVDNLGFLAGHVLQHRNTPASYAAFSRAVNLFFKRYLPRVCYGDPGFAPFDLLKKDYPARGGRNVSVIYAGGDDLFLVGAWDEVAELSYDLHRAFKAYTGHNPDLGLSGGVTLHKPSFPLYQMARLCGEAEEEAKQGGDHAYRKDRVALFYTRQLKARQQRLARLVTLGRETDRILDPDDLSERFLLHLPWDAFPDHVGALLHWFEDHLQPADDYRRARLAAPMPQGLPHRLLALVDRWQQDGRLFLPRLMWLVGKQQALRGQIDFVRLFHGEPLRHLHVPLTWIEYLKRGGT